DLDLVRRIGRRRLVALDTPAVTSAERWEGDGWRRRSARNLTCLALYLLGVPPERLARFYYGQER
ncbi:MAG: glycosyl transferase family 2, partial [Alphaproteobacteria bacterium]|nr:glycosyl transferase family 2 [Alphaproteobacteria bacterium]